VGVEHTGLLGKIKKDANGNSGNWQAIRAAFHQLSEHQGNTKIDRLLVYNTRYAVTHQFSKIIS
jgi:hypothetical protein